MSQLKMFTFMSFTNLLALFCLLILCTAINHVQSYSTYDYEGNDAVDSSYAMKGYSLRAIMGTNEDDYPFAQIHLLPFKKRTIPIELQKALYAHGIVGRRRR